MLPENSGGPRFPLPLNPDFAIQGIGSPSAGAFMLEAQKEISMDKVDRFLHHANLERFRRQLANTEDESKRLILLELLEAEEDKDKVIIRGPWR
jgi:hypothetical protein